MTRAHADWPHRWFGFWKEDGALSANCPSVIEWPKEPTVSHESALDGLMRGRLVCVMQNPGRHCHICGEGFVFSQTICSNGVWLWPEDLLHYVRVHGVLLPAAMVSDLQRPVPNEEEIDPAKLDWPPTTS